MSAADGSCSGLGEAEVADLAGLDEVFDCPGDVFNGHIGVDAMLVEEVDDAGVKALERGVRDFFDVLRAAVQSS
jgi:hypothetical protein